MSDQVRYPFGGDPKPIICPECQGDGRIRDRTGGGHHGVCPTCQKTGVVVIDLRCCGNCGHGCECNSAQSGGRGTGCLTQAWEPAVYCLTAHRD